MKTNRFLRYFFLIAFLFAVALLWFCYRYFKAPLAVQQTQVYRIHRHETLAVLSDDLAMRGVIMHPDLFLVVGQGFGFAKSLKAGSYLIKPGTSPYQFLQQITHASNHYYPVTFIDGWTNRVLLQHLAANPHLYHDVPQLSPAAEGQYLPQTYYITANSSEHALLQRAHAALWQWLDAAWPKRQAGLLLRNKTQALILASIVEEEAKLPQEMPIIAGVFYNRLRHKMPLQADPTVLYGMHKPYGSHISHRDLASMSLYNTYTHHGLPPHPIALPSLAALTAVLHPAKTSAFYFVANGDGSHIFSHSLKQQRIAIKKVERDS